MTTPSPAPAARAAPPELADLVAELIANVAKLKAHASVIEAEAGKLREERDALAKSREEWMRRCQEKSDDKADAIQAAARLRERVEALAREWELTLATLARTEALVGTTTESEGGIGRLRADLTALRASLRAESPPDDTAVYYLADGSEVRLPREEVERRRKAAAKVIEAARDVILDLDTYHDVKYPTARALSEALDRLGPDAAPATPTPTTLSTQHQPQQGEDHGRHVLGDVPLGANAVREVLDGDGDRQGRERRDPEGEQEDPQDRGSGGRSLRLGRDPARDRASPEAKPEPHRATTEALDRAIKVGIEEWLEPFPAHARERLSVSGLSTYVLDRVRYAVGLWIPARERTAPAPADPATHAHNCRSVIEGKNACDCPAAPAPADPATTEETKP